jgi:hypothetical protein
MLVHVPRSLTGPLRYSLSHFYRLLNLEPLAGLGLIIRQLSVQPATISLILTDSSTLVPLCVAYRGFRVSSVQPDHANCTGEPCACAVAYTWKLEDTFCV